MCKENMYLYLTKLAELELLDKTELLERIFTIKMY